MRLIGVLHRIAWLLMLCASGALVLLAIYAPLAQALIGFPAGEGTYAFLHNICHQFPTRCLWIDGRPVALCARCIAGYTGILIGAIVLRCYWKYRARAVIGLALFALATLDPWVQLLTPYSSNNVLRIITGIVGGVGVYFVAAPNLAKGLQLRRKA